MKTFVALDASLEKTAICIMSADGSVVAEVTAASNPEAIVAEPARQAARRVVQDPVAAQARSI